MAEMVPTDDTPTQLIPKMGEFQVSNATFYKQLVLTDAPAGTSGGDPLEDALDPFDDPPPFEATPATGVLLTFEQGWFQEGLALGELRKSLCLAPGEVTKVAVVDWDRRSRTSDRSSQAQDEAVTSRTNDETAAAQVQSGVAHQTESGFGVNSGSSNHIEAGGGFTGLFGGVSGSAARSSHQGFSASSSTGTRAVASTAVESVQRATEQLAESTRSVRATQIVEVSEAESQTTTSRVIANYNHAHAMTMQYYEVLQIYSLRTEVAEAVRCVFVPMDLLEFNHAALAAASDSTVELLRRVLKEFGAKQLDEMVGNFRSPDNEGLSTSIDALTTRISESRTQVAALAEAVEAASADLQRQASVLADATAAADRAQAQIGANFFTGGIGASIRAGSAQGVAAAELGQASVRHALAVNDHSLELAALATARAQLAAKEEALAEFDRMFGLLDDHRVLLNQQMWMRMDRHVWHRMLRGRTFPTAPYEDQEIGGLIDPKPVGYFGNYVAFIWDFPAGEEQAAEDFERLFTRRKGSNRKVSTSARVALPTDGVFAEAVLGQANSAEKIDVTRFWNWQDSPIPILPPSIGHVSTDSRAGNLVAPSGPVDFAPAVAAIRDLGLPDGIDDATLLSTLRGSLVTNGGELLASAALAGTTAANNASDGAGRAGQRVVDAQKNAQDFVVGLANSEVGKIAATAVAAGATGGISSVGGLLNAAKKGAAVVDVTDKAKDVAPSGGSSGPQ